jgi:GT2 family glycosyltransferase
MTMPFENPEIVAVKGAYKTNQKSLTARFAQAEFEERFEMLKNADSIDMVDTYSAAYRKAAFLSSGGFDPSFPVANNEDTELSYKMSRAGCKMVFNPGAVVFHLNHPDTIIKYARLKFLRGYWRMVVYKRYPDKMFKDSYTPQALKLQIFAILLLPACLPLMWLLPRLTSYFFAAVILLFMSSSLPFTMLTAKNDLTVAVLSPFFLSVRAASLGLGAVIGFLKGKTGGK